MVDRQLIVPGFFLVVAAGIWVVLLRPIPVRTAAGTITSKTLQPAGEYVQYPAGNRGSFRTPTRIPIAEHYVLGIDVPGKGALTYAANTVEAAAFEVGQRVNITYQERGLPPFWRRVYVMEVKRQD